MTVCSLVCNFFASNEGIFGLPASQLSANRPSAAPPIVRPLAPPQSLWPREAHHLLTSQDMTPKQVVAWKDHLFAQELDPKTVAEGYFAAGRSFFKWALNNQKATANPFADIQIKIPKKPKLRPKSLQEEAELILSESLRVFETRASEEFVAAKRWIHGSWPTPAPG